MPLAEARVEEVDLEEERFRVHVGGPGDGLIRSIERVGVINPPWIRRGGDGGGYQVVMGFRRIMALRLLGREVLNARLIGDGEITDAKLMEAVVLEDLSHGPFDPVEISRAIAGLRRVGIEDCEIAGRYLPLMGLEGKVSVMERYLSLADLPDDLIDALSRGEIGVGAVDRVYRRFGRGEGHRVLRLVRDLRLGVNRQRELISLLDEITRRDGVGVSAILERDEVSTVLSNERAGLPQRSRALIDRLRRMRAPRTMAMIDEVKERVRRLALGPPVTVELSPYLEERLVRVSFTFGNAGEYRKIVETLVSAGKGPEVEAMINDLFGRGYDGEISGGS